MEQSMEQQAADAPALPAKPGPADPIRIFVAAPGEALITTPSMRGRALRSQGFQP
jgi:hypothetical protein